jgi:hypothetical protein
MSRFRIKSQKKKEQDKEKLIGKLAEKEKAKAIATTPPVQSKPEVKIFGQSPMVVVGIGGTILVLGIIVVISLSKRNADG